MCCWFAENNYRSLSTCHIFPGRADIIISPHVSSRPSNSSRVEFQEMRGLVIYNWLTIFCRPSEPGPVYSLYRPNTALYIPMPTASYWARSSRTSPSLSGECQLHVVCFDSNLLYRRKISQIEIFPISLFYVVQSWWGPYYCLFDLVLYRSLDIFSLLFYFIWFFRPQHSSIIKFQSFV